MSEIKCLRCGMIFPIQRTIHRQSEKTRCAEPDCTRVFHHYDYQDGFKTFQTPDDVSLTVSGAHEHRENVGHVDNGGCQE